VDSGCPMCPTCARGQHGDLLVALAPASHARRPPPALTRPGQRCLVLVWGGEGRARARLRSCMATHSPAPPTITHPRGIPWPSIPTPGATSPGRHLPAAPLLGLPVPTGRPCGQVPSLPTPARHVQVPRQGHRTSATTTVATADSSHHHRDSRNHHSYLAPAWPCMQTHALRVLNLPVLTLQPAR
jgi:hypothetical protein